MRAIYDRVRATGRLWNSLLIVLDAAVVLVAVEIAYWLRFEGVVPPAFAHWQMPLAVVSIVLFVALFALFGLYRLVLRYVGVDTLLKLSAAVAIGTAALWLTDGIVRAVVGERPVPLGVLAIQGLLIFLGAAATRMAARVYLYVRASSASEGRRVLIIGAGSAGSLLLRELHGRPDLGFVIVGFLDDRSALRGHTISGVPVIGDTASLADVVERYRVEEVIVAMPSAPREKVREILNTAADAGVQTRITPHLVVARGSVSLRDLRSVDVEDLLGREPTPIDVAQISATVAGKVVLVTGAAGSIGSELCRQLIGLGPSRLVLVDIDETRLYELWLELETCASGLSSMSICDIRDADRLEAVFQAHHPAVVLHAAAYKHVPLMEIEPAESIKTNVLGTLNVIEACQRHGIERLVLISTDKAVAPVNFMGLSKRLAERIMLDATQRTDLCAVAVRFGNVLASRGSVVPIFEEQLRHGGPLTVTDPEVSRYFMTIPEASRLVLQAQAIGTPGDIFVLEMGDPVKIVDLARKMIALSGVPADVKFVGLRPGEKLHESLVNQAESLVSTERKNIQRVDRMDLPQDGFDRDIHSLIDAARCGDRARMDALVETLEPGFSARDAG